MKLFEKVKSFLLGEDRYDVYHPKKRMIYSYWNGDKLIDSDPLVLYKRMMDHSTDISIDMKVSSSASKDSGKAHNNLIKSIREIFEIKPLAEGGLTEIETVNLLDHFIIYSEWVKKNLNPSATSSNSLEESNSSSEESQATLNSLESGSIEKGSSTEEPVLSTSASP